MKLDEWITHQIDLGKSVEELHPIVEWVRTRCNMDDLFGKKLRTFYGTLGSDVPTDILTIGDGIVIDGCFVRIEEEMSVRWLVRMDVTHEDVEYALGLLERFGGL